LIKIINDIEFNVNREGEGTPFVWGHGLLGNMEVEDKANWFHWARMSECVNLIRYDARGHGLSQITYSPQDYVWENLAHDMVAIANSVEVDKFIAGGQSMGSATAIFAGMAEQNRIEALILITPPTAWEQRAEQSSLYSRMALIARLLGGKGLGILIARNPERLLPAWLVKTMGTDTGLVGNVIGRMSGKNLATVLRGAALCDLPPRSSLKKLNMPTLILAWEGDKSHPVETAEVLHQLIPNSEYHLAKDIYDFRTWPLIMREFVQKIS